MLRKQRADGTTDHDDSADELPLLNAVAEALHTSTDVRQALERTLGLVVGLLGLRTGWVWLLHSDTRRFDVAAAEQLPPYLQWPLRMIGKRCLCTHQFQGGTLTPSNIDLSECSRLHRAIYAQDPTATQGLPGKQIATRLRITERTVRFHTASLIRKLGADTRAQAVALAARRGLLDPP